MAVSTGGVGTVSSAPVTAGMEASGGVSPSDSTGSEVMTVGRGEGIREDIVYFATGAN